MAPSAGRPEGAAMDPASGLLLHATALAGNPAWPLRSNTVSLASHTKTRPVSAALMKTSGLV